MQGDNREKNYMNSKVQNLSPEIKCIRVKLWLYAAVLKYSCSHAKHSQRVENSADKATPVPKLPICYRDEHARLSAVQLFWNLRRREQELFACVRDRSVAYRPGVRRISIRISFAHNRSSNYKTRKRKRLVRFSEVIYYKLDVYSTNSTKQINSNAHQTNKKLIWNDGMPGSVQLYSCNKCKFQQNPKIFQQKFTAVFGLTSDRRKELRIKINYI